jgi:hypothetical protein
MQERRGAMGERQWAYGDVMENTTLRYLRKAMAARRVREIARERRCHCCRRYCFDAMRCGACKEVYYCSPHCQVTRVVIDLLLLTALPRDTFAPKRTLYRASAVVCFDVPHP